MDISNIILENLTVNDEFVIKSLPYLKEEYFEDSYQRLTFRVIKNFIDTHRSIPDQDVILIEVDKEKGVTDDDYNSIVELTTSWQKKPSNKNIDWLLSNAEEWCQNRAFFIAVKAATKTLDESKLKDRGTLPDMMREALGVSFDTQIGHDMFNDWESRWKYYTDVAEKIPCDLTLLNEMMEGGVEKKTLNIIMGGIHSGKTRFMTHLAAAYASLGLNVVYFTLEMAEEKIAHRIDANLLGISMDQFKKLSKSAYQKAIEDSRKKTKGEVIVKEFPTGVGHSGHFRHVIKELKLKRDFTVDVIFIDYINICASARAKAGSDSYTYVNMIAQELRGLGQEFKIPVWSATQVNRAAFSSSDPDMDDVAESWGLPGIADWLGAIISDDQLILLGQFILKQLKSRYSDMHNKRKGLINFDNTLMRLTNAPQTSTSNNPAAPPPQTKSKGAIPGHNFSGFKT